MGLFNRARTVVEPERRQARRIRIDCSATLVMPSGDRAGRLVDISEDGARFVTSDPPGRGCAAILEWPLFEAYCKITWSNSEGCGIEFDRSLPRSVMLESAALFGIEGSSAATPALRPVFGQKRGPRAAGG